MTAFKNLSPISRLFWLVAIFVIAIVAALLWFALSAPEPAPEAAAPAPADGRYVPCPAGSRPKAGQPHICVPEDS